MRHIPLWAYDAWVSRATDWLAMTEDLPRPDNRVTLTPDGRIVPRLPARTTLRAHAQLVEELRASCSGSATGRPKSFAHSAGAKNTTHQCGTLVFGTDPRASVLDPFCRAHDVENLFVVDASFFPSSAAVNPGLTIAAQALRVADHIARPTIKAETLVKARSFSHVGITVSDFNRAVRFWWDVFGCPLVGVADTPPDRVRGFFGVDVPGATCKIGWIRIPGGAVIEIFHF